MRHKNIPVFIPHLGCPNDCVFCNQRKITEHTTFREEDVKATIDEAVATLLPDDDAEIAFFGGSFTGIDRSRTRNSVNSGKSARSGTRDVSNSTRKPSEPTPVEDHPVVNQS